jgi:kanamycin kinase
MSTRGATLDDVGFVHASFAHQVATIGELLYAGAAEPLVVLTIDTARAGVPVRVENLEGGDERFPHLYGELPTSAVVDVRPAAIAPDGTFRFADDPVPGPVVRLARGQPAELAWRNELGGLTFRVGDEHIKWNPRRNGIDLGRERVRLQWLEGRHPAPRVLAWDEDEHAQWLVTASLRGSSAVGDEWRARRPEAIRAIAAGLRAIHAIAIDDFPAAWVPEVWPDRAPEALGPRPPVDEVVLVHGDACAPNTLIAPSGAWVGNVDFGDLGVGDRWADLAVASMSVDWNFGPGHQDELFDAYGIDRDDARISYYRSLWHLES